MKYVIILYLSQLAYWALYDALGAHSSEVWWDSQNVMFMISLKITELIRASVKWILSTWYIRQNIFVQYQSSVNMCDDVICWITWYMYLFRLLVALIHIGSAVYITMTPDCGNSSVLVMELPQLCAKSSIFKHKWSITICLLNSLLGVNGWGNYISRKISGNHSLKFITNITWNLEDSNIFHIATLNHPHPTIFTIFLPNLLRRNRYFQIMYI